MKFVLDVYSNTRKHPSNRAILIGFIKRILNKFGDIHVKDNTIVKKPVLFHACDLGISGDGDNEKMDKEIYSVLLDASSCINPIMYTG